MEASDWISVGAVFISLLALGISLYEAMANKPRLRISAKLATSRDLKKQILAVVIVNFGRQPTMISHVSIVTKGTKNTIAASSTHEGNTLPHLLESGRLVTFSIPCDVYPEDPFDTGSSETIGQLLSRGQSRVMVRDSWRSKPHYIAVR